jgi:hypothetical protein
MPVRLHHIVVDAHDLPGLARFWTQALGWKVLSERETRSSSGLTRTRPSGPTPRQCSGSPPPTCPGRPAGSRWTARTSSSG